jgi:hypothetical protein|tara:strand:+ start:145 stop:1161 length:1017 start_codon:yes stop_codon:yes gene_type:complete
MCFSGLARVVVVMASIGLLCAVVPAGAQTESAEDWTPPRLSDGRPDLQGVWLSNTATPLQRPPVFEGREFLTDEEVATLRARAGRIFQNGRSAFTTPEGAFFAALNDVDTYGGPSSTSNSLGMVDVEFTNRTSQVIDPPDGRIPALTAAGQAREARVDTGWEFKTGPEDLNNFHRCVTTGVPRLGGNFGSGPYTFYQIVQTPDHLAFLSEAFHDARLIALDGHPHLSQNIRQWNGDPRGHWDGDTLVVETRNFASGSYFYGSAGELHLVERFTRTGPDTILYQLTFTDPTTWESPWTAEIPLKRRDQTLFEFACHEGNVSMGGMLRTARLADAAVDGR